MPPADLALDPFPNELDGPLLAVVGQLDQFAHHLGVLRLDLRRHLGGLLGRLIQRSDQLLGDEVGPTMGAKPGHLVARLEAAWIAGCSMLAKGHVDTY